MPPPHKKSFAAEQLALRQKKKVSPVVWVLVVVVVVVLVVGGYMIYQRSEVQRQAETQQIKSVAVLAFEDMTPEKNMEYLGDGMAEAIINALSTIDSLRVPARNSTFVFKGEYHDIREIGSKLDVDAVLEGSIQKPGNKFRISVQLIRVSDDQHLWSKQYDSFVIDDVLSVQDSISLSVLKELKFTLMGKEKAAIVKRYTNDPDAYELFLKGEHFHRMMTEDGLEKATRYYEQAFQQDPNYALAYLGLGGVWLTRSYWGNILPPHEAYSKVREYVKKALEIDDTLAEAHESLGLICTFYDWDWEAAERELKQALKLNPNKAGIHRSYSYLLTVTGRHDESIVEAKRAQELDPLSSNIHAHAGQALTYAGRLDEAIEDLKKTVAMDPDFFFSHFVLGRTYFFKSMFEEASTELEKAIDLSGGTPMAVSDLIAVYYLSGKKSQAKKLYDSLVERSKHEYVPPVCFFLYNYCIGDLDQAFDWLEEAYDTRDSYLCWRMLDQSRKTLPFFNNFYSDPRYKAMLKKMNLPED